jgi:hypothetical protein
MLWIVEANSIVLKPPDLDLSNTCCAPPALKLVISLPFLISTQSFQESHAKILFLCPQEVGTNKTIDESVPNIGITHNIFIFLLIFFIHFPID